MVAAVTSRPHWAVEKDEADSIAAPLETVLSNLTPAQIKAVEKYTAPAVLLMAVAGVVTPRIMIDLSQAQGNKTKNMKVNNIGIVQTKAEKIDIQPNNGNNERPIPSLAVENGRALNSAEITNLFG